MNEGKKAGEILLETRLTGVEELQAKLDAASAHIDTAREILDGLAGGVMIGAELIASGTTSRSGDTTSSPDGE